MSENGLVDFCRRLEGEYELRTSVEARKEMGQVFTPPSVCRFMAGLFCRFPEEFRLLDPGAGAGALTAAVCERYASLRSPRLLEVHLFEKDSKLVDMLERTMDHCRRAMAVGGHAMNFQIHEDDFVLASSGILGDQLTLFEERQTDDGFDGVITNPPYFKLNKDSAHARVAAEVIRGQPNIYALFLAIAANRLRAGGELVAITPRSFCNGLYFREFRSWFLRRMSLSRIHLFESRSLTFRDASVLQESVVTMSRRLGKVPDRVTVTHSFDGDLSERLEELELATDKVVGGPSTDFVVRIPESVEDAKIMDCMDSWGQRFSDVGLRISTGPVVMFRAKDFLRMERVRGSVPLLSAHNIKPFQTVWPVQKPKWPVAFADCDDSARHLVPTRNYVLLKRFSAKEERRRLVAGCFLHESHDNPRVALENHINYVYHSARELTDDEVFGIAALFNSVLFDRYFRSISGNTQVNATEIRTMPFPDLDVIARIGADVRMTPDSPEVEKVVLSHLGINGELERYLNERVARENKPARLEAV